MTRKQPTTIDWRQFFDHFRSESDRACAILGRALLEEKLRRLLEARIVIVSAADSRALFEGQGPLASFSSRIRICHAVGWIAEDDARDLHGIREIGNEFAHHIDHALAFDDASIRSKVFNLKCPVILTKYGPHGTPPLSREEIEAINTKTRKRFEIGVGLLDYLISDAMASSSRLVAPKSMLQVLESSSFGKEPS